METRSLVANLVFLSLLSGPLSLSASAQFSDNNPDAAGKSVPCGEGVVCAYDNQGRLDHWTTEYELTYIKLAVGFFSERYTNVKEKFFVIAFSSIRKRQEDYNQWAQKHGYPMVKASGHLTRQTLSIPARMAKYRFWNIMTANNRNQINTARNGDFIGRCNLARDEYKRRHGGNPFFQCQEDPGEFISLDDCGSLLETYEKCPQDYPFLDERLKEQLDTIRKARRAIKSYKRLANAPETPSWISAGIDTAYGFEQVAPKTVEDDYIDPDQLPKDFSSRLKQAKERMDDAVANAERIVGVGPNNQDSGGE